MRTGLILAVVALAGAAACSQDVTPQSGTSTAPAGATAQAAPAAQPAAEPAKPEEEKKPQEENKAE